MLTALARLADTACVVVAQDRATQRRREPIGPGALRQVRRCIALASELRLPLVTVIDTPGAALSREAEEGGLAGEIARCLSDLLRLPSPTVSLLLGEGAGGAALALLPADRVVAAEHSWLAPLPPEGASAILHGGDISFAPELAAAQGVAVARLQEAGVVDLIVPESPDVATFSRDLVRAVSAALAEAADEPWSLRAPRRAQRYRRGQ
ncbi:hypothetical protein GCM10025881_30310 [Pseudolysinimonas kribbensis]|uniref:acetyl-CoA carboxytransferase n=1 Tax=Pseudolysinimonas kribbensis TaxID=433641 RepID=A0ABQ6K6F5_9MICO|nr:hypothetical protein GCM10025881_30310 [Pseudolysinimonas kribbensis]